MEKNQLSLGEKIVRTAFNPSNESVVQHIKERGAEFINYLDENVADKNAEATELKKKAIDAIELASMYAVKAATV
jgi:hypothetical protein